MRFTLVFLLLLLSPEGFTKNSLKVVDDFYQESSSLLTQAEKEADYSQKVIQLNSLKKSFEETLENYKKANPKLGDVNEEQIALLYYTLEPVFNLLSKTTVQVPLESCLSTLQEIKTGDSMGRTENSPSSRQGQVAIDWLKVLCPEGIAE